MSNDNNVNTGVLFRNDNRTKTTHPHARGNADVCCPHCGAQGKFWLSAWTNTAKSGKRAGQKYQSLSFTMMEDQPKPGETNTMAVDPSLDEDIPF